MTAAAEFDNVLDVRGRIVGGWEYALVRTGRHDSCYFAHPDAVTTTVPVRLITRAPRIAGPDAVRVDREEPVMAAGGEERST